MEDFNYRKIFSQNLNYYMQINGKIQDDLIRDLGLKSATISSWCTGKKMPRVDKIEMLAKYFGISFSDLVKDRSINENIETTTKIPLISEFQNNIDFSLSEFHIKDIVINAKIPSKSFGILIKDNSMLPLLDSGDYAIIYPTNLFESGATYLILNHGIAIIRKIIKINDLYELHAFNVYYPIEKVKELNIIGKVIRAEMMSAFK